MTRTDSLVVGALVLVLAMLAGLVGASAVTPTAPVGASPSDPPIQVADRPYVEGVLGRPTSVSPLSARTQADRDLVALVFSGLVRNGPDGTLVPDLAERWSVDQTGSVWTFQIRPDATWHDGEPVTADDVAFTIHVLQDHDYHGPGAGSWNEVEVTTLGQRTVVMTLTTPLSGFLQAATQPIAPAHLLSGIAVDRLADDPFGRQPIGSGPFAVASLTQDKADLIPSTMVMPEATPSAGASPVATDSLATPTPVGRPTRPTPYLKGIEFRFFDDPAALAAAYRMGGLDAASGLPPAVGRDLATTQGSRALRYPGSTLTAVFLNLRPGQHPECANPAVRTALLAAIDRRALIADAFAMGAGSATSAIPPSSSLFDPTADPPVAHDVNAAKAALKAAGWTLASDGWHLPKAAKPLTIELLSPDEASNPAAYQAAVDVTDDWAALGLTVVHRALPPGEFSSGRLATGEFTAAVGDVTVGLDPDLYPLLASSQTLSGGSNIIGLQDPKLDGLLIKARGPNTDQARRAAYSALQVQLGKGRYLLPLAFADESVVVRDTVSGPVVRQVADPADRFWDVLTWRLAAGR
jgi:peptide/nickel transport system substrate-binding protein